MSTNKHEVTNALQACNDLFIRPSEVFKALSMKDNWSWVPFILVAVISALPAYLYFGVVDYDWYVDIQMSISQPDASPAELDNMRPFYGTGSSAAGYALLFTPLFLILSAAVLGLYYTLITRNDEKSVHSFFDWYGAQWWFMMPSLIASVISLAVIVMVEPGAQLSPAVLAPTSFSYILSLSPNDAWFNFFTYVRLDTIWTIFLGGVCLQHWTNFSSKKSFICAAVPSMILLSIGFVVAVV